MGAGSFGRGKVFTRQLYNDIFVDSLRYCQHHKGLEVYAWCLTTNHAHLIISSETGNLSAILRDLKRHTSKAVLKAMQKNEQESRRDWMRWLFERAGKRNPHNEQYQFWQQGSHPSSCPPTSCASSGSTTCTAIW